MSFDTLVNIVILVECSVRDLFSGDLFFVFQFLSVCVLGSSCSVVGYGWPLCPYISQGKLTACIYS